ncbi:hypothetical protein F4782DRAFT_510250 [Xylaria castorea]|nr:hypothetical protein F4782DRAFT_510250 [Xylaria castorea]
MNRWTSLLLLLGASASSVQCTSPHVPSLIVPSCDKGTGNVQYDRSVPNGESKFPLTKVNVCYTTTDIKITFTALEEVNYFYNKSQTTNDPLYEYEVMEAFIYHGTNDPRSYFEFEVSPNNVTWQAFIYNPSKIRAPGAPYDGGIISQPIADGIVASTVLDRDAGTWVSNASIPLGFFNVDDGQAKGTRWRMNFFRIVVSPETFPAQFLGAWSPTNMSNFHETPFFGNVLFV